MARAVCKARAPGSLMMMGEHAVLHGHPALVAAVNAWMQVELIPRDDRRIRIESSLGIYDQSMNDLPDDPQFRFVLEALRRYRDRMPSGCSLLIESEFRSTIGFGSSAAVTVAALGSLQSFCGQKVEREAVAREARTIIRAVQGRGSGADAAASALGGMVLVDPANDSFERIPFTPPISIIYCGYKTPTPEVILQVEKYWADREADLQALYQSMGDCTREALRAARAADLEAFACCCDRYHQHLVDLGVSNPDLDDIAERLRTQVSGAKISGAGRGDCIIGIGSSEAVVEGYENVTVPLSKMGLNI